MTERIPALQCIGCGRIEGARPCVGIGQDRKTEFVYASDHDEALAQLVFGRGRAEALAALVRQLACTTPRKDDWERTYRALQARAPDAGVANSGGAIPGIAIWLVRVAAEQCCHKDGGGGTEGAGNAGACSSRLSAGGAK